MKKFRKNRFKWIRNNFQNISPEKLLDVNDFINNKINFSLNLLGQKKIYGLLIHNPDVLLGKSGNEIYDQLMILKKQGKISKIGIPQLIP